MVDEGPSTFDRRGLLGAVATAGLVGTAGCLSGDDDGGDEPTAENAVVVGPGGNYAFDPETITVAAGETVTWTWGSRNHNIVVDAQPADADWQGTEGGPSETYDADHEVSFTFDVEGTYEYYCSPHEGLGMRGEVVVETD